MSFIEPVDLHTQLFPEVVYLFIQLFLVWDKRGGSEEDCGGLWDEGSISRGGPTLSSTTRGAKQLLHVLPRAHHGPESASREVLGTSKPIPGQNSVNLANILLIMVLIKTLISYTESSG